MSGPSSVESRFWILIQILGTDQYIELNEEKKKTHQIVPNEFFCLWIKTKWVIYGFVVRILEEWNLDWIL